MKLYEALPDEVRVGRKRYRVDLDFRNVLRMYDILGDDGLTPDAREYLAGKCVCKHPGPGLVDAVKALIAHKGKASDHKRVTSFEQDAGLIRAAFLQTYGVDLWHEKLHWLAFLDLLNGLPEDTQYMSVVGIRARPMPKPTKYNREEIAWLKKAKATYALEETEQEREQSYNQSVADLFHGLMAMIPKG